MCVPVQGAVDANVAYMYARVPVQGAVNILHSAYNNRLPILGTVSVTDTSVRTYVLTCKACLVLLVPHHVTASSCKA